MVATLGDVGAGHSLGRYELLLPIASGGMAVVWAARLKGTRGFQKLVAIKTMRPEMVEDAQFEQMFLDEASLASRIRHPHIVEILDLGEEDGVLYLVMEWIDGEPLHILMKEASSKGGIPLPIAVRIAMQMCAGLHAAHELRDEHGKLVGLVHRDVSPQNVLVTWDGVAKVVDFGVAKAIGRGAEETNAGQIKGKTAYMAPEQARGATIDRRTDIFAIGILLYTMTTGRHPFRRDTDVGTMMNICSDERVYRPGKLVSGYPPQLERVLMQALEKDPAKRFPSASDMLKALDRALPSSMRISADDEVAAFIQSMLSDRFEKRRQKIKEGLRLADERAAGEVARKSAEVTNPLIVPLSETSSPGSSTGTGPRPGAPPAVERWSVSDAVPAMASTPHPSSPQFQTAPVAILVAPEISSPRITAVRSSGKLFVMAAIAAGIVIVVGALAALRASGKNKPSDATLPSTAAIANLAPSQTSTSLPSASISSPSATTSLPSASISSPSATTSLPSASNAETAPLASDSAQAPADGASGRRAPAGKASGRAPATSATSAKDKPISTAGNLPQIRDPGF